MGSTQRPSQKGKGTQAMPAGARAAAAAGAKQGNGEEHALRPCRLSAQERQLLVKQLAYSRAEKRGFAAGEEWRDWFEAEAEVNLLLANRKPSRPD